MLCFGDGVRIRRWLTLVSGLFECLCFAGAVFGWASLVFVLKAEGYFRDLCVNGTVANGTASDDCTGQDEQLSLIFTIASFLNNFLLFPNGFFFDRFGTMATRLLAVMLYTMGTLFIAFSSPATPNLLFPALPFIAVGGILFLMTNMQVGNLFGAHQSTIITLYNGAFDSSSAVLLVVKVLFEGGITLRASMLFLSCCSIIHLLRTIFLMPGHHIPQHVPENYTYGIRCGSRDLTGSNEPNNETDMLGNENGQPQMPQNEQPQVPEPAGPGPVKEELTFCNCVLSRFFVWHVLWLSVMQLRHYLFIGTLNPMLTRLTGEDPALVSKYTNAFAITQLFGVICAPWNGLIMDRHKGRPRASGESEKVANLRASILSLFLTALQCLLFSLCATLPILPLQYLTFALQVLNRSFLYGGNAAFIRIAFPACHFGKLYGLIMALSAVVSLLQYPFFSLVKDVLKGDPLYMNVALTVLTLLAFIHPLFVWRWVVSKREMPIPPQ